MVFSFGVFGGIVEIVYGSFGGVKYFVLCWGDFIGKVLIGFEGSFIWLI